MGLEREADDWGASLGLGLLLHFEGGFGEGFAHEGEGFGAAEVVVAGGERAMEVEVFSLFPVRYEIHVSVETDGLPSAARMMLRRGAVAGSSPM
jgi:hypothetical protein